MSYNDEVQVGIAKSIGNHVIAWQGPILAGMAADSIPDFTAKVNGRFVALKLARTDDINGWWNADLYGESYELYRIDPE